MNEHPASKDEYRETLENYDIVVNGIQANIYVQKNGKNVLKEFIYPEDEKEKRRMSDEVITKLHCLDEIKSEFSKNLRKRIAFPVDIIMVDGICAGYTMHNIGNTIKLADYASEKSMENIKERLQVCVRLYDMVGEMHYYFVIGDCHMGQFELTDTYEICVFDTDTFGIIRNNINASPVGIDAYRDPKVTDKYSHESDMYSMAIIAFQILTGNLSAFGGIYNGNAMMNFRKRMQMGVSILHDKGVTLHNIKGITIDRVAWMSIDTHKAFYGILDCGERYSLKHVFMRQIDDLDRCKKHGLNFSSSRYRICPKCCGLSDEDFFYLFSKQIPYDGIKELDVRSCNTVVDTSQYSMNPFTCAALQEHINQSLAKIEKRKAEEAQLAEEKKAKVDKKRQIKKAQEQKQNKRYKMLIRLIEILIVILVILAVVIYYKNLGELANKYEGFEFFKHIAEYTIVEGAISWIIINLLLCTRNFIHHEYLK